MTQDGHGPSDYEYGSCPCTGMFDQRFIEVELVVAQRPVLLTDIPQGECALCGSQVYKMNVIERIENLMLVEGQPV